MVQVDCTSYPLVYVVVLTWNQRETTLECLESLTQMVYPRFRIVVVDNGSTDGTTEAIQSRFPGVEVIINERNLGYPGGCNVGLRYALSQGAEYIFAINNDVSVDPLILNELVCEAAPDVGILAPKIYFASDPQKIWSVGGCRDRLTFEMKCRGDGERDQGQWSEVIERDYLIGCAHLFSAPVLRDIGLLDAGYFLYYDDLDICIRARQAGYRLLMVPQARMWHKIADSSGGVGTPRERYYMARSNVRFLRKHVRSWQYLFVIPYRTGSIIKTLLRLIWHKRLDSARAYLRGLRDGLKVSIEFTEVPLCES